MAGKKGCRLCGGRVLSSGICSECGFDNSKSDEKYHLNTYNEDGIRLHQGDCEEILNRRKPGRRPESRTRGKTKIRTQSNSQAQTQQKEQNKKTAKTKSTAKTQTKRFKWLRWLVVLFFLIEILDSVSVALEGVSEFWSDLKSGVQNVAVEFGFQADEEEYDDDGQNSETLSGRPERESWDENADGYVTIALEPGVYYVGYEIPEGTYQLECLNGSAGISIWNLADAESDSEYLILYSDAEQASYQEYMDGEECPWYELSSVLDLEEDMVLAVDSMSEDVWLTGEGAGMESLAEHEAQEESMEDCLLDTEETATAGVDFPTGVYDISISGDAPCAYVQIEKESGYYSGILLSEELEEYLRYPFEEGDTVTVTTYNEDTEVWLLPGW
ncbi:MAG: hypothetical protein LIO94_00745 [Clostridiales bacterium]|nr:hypothetical protein [Clostridiales bacterium]